MSDEKSVVGSIEDKIKNAAKEIETFADKVTADEEPTVIVSDDNTTQADKIKKDR